MKLSFIEIIESVTPDPNLLMWKYPDEDKEIKNGAQLTVRESQAALFLNEGQLADVFRAGLYKLRTENVPLLSQLKGWKYGFESPFKADIYYFNTRHFVNNKWGTPAPILLNDPLFGQIRIRAFGTFDIQITDIPTFFRQYAGSYERFTIFELQHELRDYIAPKFGEVLANEQLTITHVAGNITDLSQKVTPLLRPYFEQFGLTLTQFMITSVTLPEEVTQHYDKISNMNMVTDMDKYTKFSTAQAISQKGTDANEATRNAIAFSMLMDRKILEEQTPPPEHTQEDIAEKLKKLKSLFDSELIDEDDYKIKKTELLKKL